MVEDCFYFPFKSTIDYNKLWFNNSITSRYILV